MFITLLTNVISLSATHKTVSLSSLREDVPCIPSPFCHSQSSQTLSAEHFENNIPEIRIEVPSVSISTEHLLSVPNTRVKCYKIPPDNDLCLCEDIFQQHQAKLVNCDSEDANAISRNRMNLSQENLNDSNNISSNKTILFGNPKADVIRYQCKSSNAMISKSTNKSLENITFEPKQVEIGKWVPLPGMRRCKSDFYLNRNGEWAMVHGDPKESFSEEIRVYNLNETPSKCYKEVLESVVSSTSTSDCDCENDSFSPKSTESSSTSSITLTLRPTINENTVIDDNSLDEVSTSKLTASEREQTLKELDDIVSGKFLKKITDFSKEDICNMNTQSKMSKFLSDMLKLDLSTANKSSSSSEDEMLQYGCGRVAALAKHFSRMGEAGIIRGQRTTGDRGKGFRSEPDIARLTKDWLMTPQLPGAATETNEPSSNLQMIFTSFGVHPVGFSMDRLIDIGNQGVILKEIEVGKANEVDNPINITDNSLNNLETNNGIQNTVEDIILEGNYEDPCIQQLFLKPRSMRFNSWTQTSDSIDLDKETKLDNDTSNLSQNALECFEKKHAKNILANFKKMSLSLDSYSNKDKSNPIDLNKKSISVDEIELRKLRKPHLQKHLSLIDLNAPNDCNEVLLEDDKLGVMSNVGCKKLNGFRERRGKFCSSEEISKQYGMREDISKDFSLRKWLSVDGTEAKRELSARCEKLDTGIIKDSLRKIHRHNEGMGRKLKRAKKIDQKMFVVSPCRNSDVASRGGAITLVSCDKVDYNCIRRNSVPASLRSEMQDPLSKL